MPGRLDIIDPVHGFIRAGDGGGGPAELEIIDSPAFQRLRRIRQLSGAHLVYPGAHHTRFEHSLGVMHIAGQAALSLREGGHISEGQAEALRLAGLLHDIGHGPFSHPFDEVAGNGAAHERMGERIVRETAVGDALERAGHRRGSVAGIAFGGRGAPAHLREAVSGPLGADAMDYLQRDGHFTGVEHARVDHRRIVQSLAVHRRRIELDASALSSFQSAVISRYQMFRAVYFHRTVRAAEVMLVEAMRLADPELGLTSAGLDDYLELTDEAVLRALLSLEGGAAGPGRAARLARDYLDRRLWKCAYERDCGGPGAVPAARIRAELSAASGEDEEDVIVDVSERPSASPSPSEEGGGPSVALAFRDGGRIAHRRVPMSDMPLVSAMSGHMNILRVYATAAARPKVEIAARSVLGGPGSGVEA